MTALETLFAIFAIGMLLVIVPYWLYTWLDLRGGRLVHCPNTGDDVFVEVDAVKAALKAPIHDEPPVHVAACPLWPRNDCQEACLHKRA